MKNPFTIILLLSFLLKVLSKKKRKKNKTFPDPESVRPSSVSKELFCDACEAIIKEACKNLRGKKKESDVEFYLTDVCNPEKYNIYHFPPPDMGRGCREFVAVYGDEIPKVLINRNNDEEPVQILCYDTTKVCVNIDWGNISPIDDSIMIDGEPVKMSDLQENNQFNIQTNSDNNNNEKEDKNVESPNDL